MEGSPRPDRLQPLEALADALAERLAARLPLSAPEASPWMTTEEAIQYTRVPRGTFQKLAAQGVIPSHGGRSKRFYRPEVDRALLGYAPPQPNPLRPLGSGDAAKE